MKIGIKKVGWYHYNVYARRLFFFSQKIGTATISLDSKHVNLEIPKKYRSYAVSIGNYIRQEHTNKTEQSS